MHVFRRDMLLFLFGLMIPTAAVGDECISIEAPVVRTGDLRRAIQLPGSLGDDRILARTPDPGTRRWISRSDLLHWGLQANPGLPREGICVQRLLQRLVPESVLESVQGAVIGRYSTATSVQVTSFQPEFGPPGRIHMIPSGYKLLSTSDDSCRFLWRGALEYEAHRSIPVRVLGSFRLSRIVFIARRDLKPGDPLLAGDYERRTQNGCAAQTEVTTDPPEGSLVRQPLPRGEILRPAMLLPPCAVRQGATVRIAGRVGGALVTLDAVAEKDGRRGEAIFVRNQETGKRIWVVLTGPGEGLTAKGWH